MSDFNKDILPKIKQIDDNLGRLRLKKITLRKSGLAEFDFICDKSVSDYTCIKIEDILRGYLPETFKECRVNVSKIVADPELVSNEIVRYLKSEFMSVANCIEPSNVRAFLPSDGKCEYVLTVDEDIYGYILSNNVTDKISAHLYENFCCLFHGEAINSGKTEANADMLEQKINTSEFETIKCRTLKVNDPVKLWGEDIEGVAIYAADAQYAQGVCCFAGTITSINQKETQKGKTFYIIELDDTTGKIQGKVFMTKEKEKKIDKLQIGTQILCRGDLSMFNGAPSFKISDVSFCVFPQDFKPEERPSKSVPEFYAYVTPEPIEDMAQAGLFDVAKSVPECLIGQTFVVVDIETTGLSYLGGDKITEIGAVKIVDGKIVDKFQTLINPERRISEEITKLTGISEDMVKDMPTFDKIIPDFFKYAAGSIIVGHNLDFDYKFIKFYAKEQGYTFKNEGIDTLPFAREVVPRLKNHKLNTVCDHFSIEFLHHRALSDAHATAKLFLELVRIKKELPKFM